VKDDDELAATQPRAAWRFLDLEPVANQKCKDDYGRQGNNLAKLPRGFQTLAGVKFRIGEGLILLSGKTTAHDKPRQVEGIQVGASFSKLHVLHATHWPAAPGATVGHYTVRYEDKSEELVPLVYGQNVSDWWHAPGTTPPSRAAIGWESKNFAKDACSDTVRLYVTTWNNPNPFRPASSIDFSSTGVSEAAPFCVAMTIE
jgi:hypothetical protein